MNWSKYQRDIFEAVASTDESLIISAVAGSGKCLGYGTPVLMHNGAIVRVEDIHEGSLLMGPDSLPRRVLTTCKGRGPLYRIVPEKGDQWVCNGDHILVLVGTNRFKGQTIEIAVKDYLERSRKQKSFCAQWKLWRTGVEFEDQAEDLEVEPYLVGLWLGDGTSANASFTTTDYEIIRYLAEAASRHGCEAVLSRDRDCIRVRYRMGVRGEAGRNTPFFLHRFFQSRCRNTDGAKIIDAQYATASKENRLKLLAGLLDTDGHLGANCYDFVSKFKSLAEHTAYLCRSLGLAAYIAPKVIADATYYRVSISGDVAQIPCLLTHKLAKERKQIKRVNVTGFEIVSEGVGNYYGFTLSGDGRFLLGDFTVTHNTTTIVEAIRHVPASQSVLFCAFNKAIAETLKLRITQPNATCATLHSLGLRAWQSFCGGGVRVEGRKLWDLAKELLSWEQRKSGGLVKLVGLAKQYGIVPSGLQKLSGTFLATTPPAKGQRSLLGPSATQQRGVVTLDELPETAEGCVARGLLPDSEESWQELMSLHDVDSEEVELGLARQLLRESLLQAREVVDYDDMLYLPIVCQAPFQQFDVVFVDECQDLNGIQVEQVARSVASGGRVVAVGDPAQGIYRFRGAMADAMARLGERFECRPLPLSISYRCPKSVVRRAQSWVPIIEPAPEALEGLVEEPGEWLMNQFKPEDVILCRLTKPLVALAFRLIRARIPCRVLGRDIGQGLLKLVDKSRLRDERPVGELGKWLEAFEERESQKLKREQQWAKIGLLHDKCETLRIFAQEQEREAKSTVGQVRREIEALFKDNGSGAGLTLSTVHKFKGQEAPRVFVLDAGEYMPPRWATDLESERNLCYVACTRAQRELRYIESDSLK